MATRCAIGLALLSAMMTLGACQSRSEFIMRVEAPVESGKGLYVVCHSVTETGRTRTEAPVLSNQPVRMTLDKDYSSAVFLLLRKEGGATSADLLRLGERALGLDSIDFDMMQVSAKLIGRFTVKRLRQGAFEGILRPEWSATFGSERGVLLLGPDRNFKLTILSPMLDDESRAN